MPVTVTSTPPPPKNPKTSVSAAKAASTTAARAEALTGFGQLFQVPLMLTKQYADAGALSLHWPNVAREVASLAETQPAIARLIDPLMQAGPYAGLITAILPFAVQIAVNHGRVPAGAMGSVPAETLSSQIETGLAQAQLEALRMQKQAEAEARKIRAEIQASRDEVMANAA